MNYSPTRVVEMKTEKNKSYLIAKNDSTKQIHLHVIKLHSFKMITG